MPHSVQRGGRLHVLPALSRSTKYDRPPVKNNARHFGRERTARRAGDTVSHLVEYGAALADVHAGL